MIMFLMLSISYRSYKVLDRQYGERYIAKTEYIRILKACSRMAASLLQV
jgi:hypothetical protein